MFVNGQSFIPVRLFFFFYKKQTVGLAHSHPSFAFLLNKLLFIL